MNSRTRYRALVVLLCSLCIPQLPIWAQSVYGTISGNITDATDAVVPGAKITARNENSGATFNTVSSSSGSYRITELPLGRYDVTISAPGFSTATETGSQVTLNNVTSLNVTLKTGAVSETVSVDASAPTVETQTSDINGNVQARQIIQLPLALGAVGALRSPEAFVFLLPGTTGPGSGSSNNGVFLEKIGGGQSFGNEVLLDGVSQQRSENGSSFDEEAPSVEALQEFKVTTSIPSAQYGRTTGGIESFVTKAGTNLFHGSVFELFKNNVLDANTWFNNGYKAQECVGANDTGACREEFNVPSDKKNDYGGSLGGPVSIPHLYNGKDHSFFFFSWEQFQQNIGGTPITTLPTAAEQAGDFSAILGAPTGITNPCTGAPVLQNQIFDPATTSTAVTATNPNGTPCRLPFPGNMINTPLSSQALGLAKYIPPANLPGTQSTYGIINNFAFPSSYSINNTTETIRGDQLFSDKDKIFGSYSSRENNRYVNQPILPFPVDSGGFKQDFTTHFGRGGWDHVFSPILLNHFLLGFNRSNSKNYAAATLGTINYSAQAGIGNINSFAFPVLHWDGLDGFGAPNDFFPAFQGSDYVDNAFIFHDNVDWQKGRNSLTFGGEFRIQQFSAINLSVPQLYFLHSETDFARVGGAQNQSGNSYASFLLGATDSANQNVPLHQPRWDSRYIAGFIQDDLKVSSTLTLNLGLRYSIDFPRLEAHNLTSNFSLTEPDPAANGLPGAFIFGPTCHCNAAWAATYYKDFAPRLGFAYSPSQSKGNTVFRGGFAMLYGPLQYVDFGSDMQQGYTANPNPISPDGFTPAFNLGGGFPAFQRTVNTDPGQLTGAPGTFNPVPNNFISSKYGRTATIYNWSLQMQQQLAQDLIFTLGYIGQSAQNLRSSLQNINNIPVADFAFGNALLDNVPQGGTADGVNAPYPTFTGQVQRALRPFPQYDYIATDCCLQNLGHSSYDALLASLTRQFRNGLNLQISYTWAKNVTDADSLLPSDNAGGATEHVDNHQLEKSVSAQNIPQNFVASYLYQLPFGKGRAFLSRGNLLNYAVGGWQIGGVQRYTSGQPIPFGCATGVPGYQNCIRYTKGPEPLESDAYRRNKSGPNVFNGESWFNPVYPQVAASPAEAGFIDQNATAVRGAGPWSFGTGIPRVTEAVTSPAYLSEDFSLIKNIPITEGIQFQLKVEALDAFNRHDFSLPDLTPNDGVGRFGVPNSTFYGPRNLQITGRIDF